MSRVIMNIVIDQMERHIGLAPAMKYVVRWYMYSEEHGNLEPLKQKP